jgi:hypothetical protein
MYAAPSPDRGSGGASPSATGRSAHLIRLLLNEKGQTEQAQDDAFVTRLVDLAGRRVKQGLASTFKEAAKHVVEHPCPTPVRAACSSREAAALVALDEYLIDLSGDAQAAVGRFVHEAAATWPTAGGDAVFVEDVCAEVKRRFRA